MSCPKRITHGPCGAMWEGMCEVSGDEPCAFAGLSLADAAYREGHATCSNSPRRAIKSHSETVYADCGTARVRMPPTLSASAQADQRANAREVSPETSPRQTEKHKSEQSGTFREKLEGGRFVVTGEVAPPHGVDCSAMIASIRRWAPVCDAVNITDNQGAALHLSSLAASRMALDEGVESIFQQTCRDRNRLALQSDLLAAHTLGLRNFLAVTGDNARATSAVRRMFDLDSTQLLRVASGLNAGVTMEGTSIGEPTAFYLGAAAFLDVEPWDAQLARIAQKIEAGARFFQTQAIMDPEKATERIAQIQQLGARVIPGVLLLKNTQVIDFINERLEGLHVPERLRRRIEGATDPLAEAIGIATEQAISIAQIADGIHVMPLGEDDAGIEVIKRAGIR